MDSVPSNLKLYNIEHINQISAGDLAVGYLPHLADVHATSPNPGSAVNQKNLSKYLEYLNGLTANPILDTRLDNDEGQIRPCKVVKDLNKNSASVTFPIGFDGLGNTVLNAYTLLAGLWLAGISGAQYGHTEYMSSQTQGDNEVITIPYLVRQGTIKPYVQQFQLSRGNAKHLASKIERVLFKTEVVIPDERI